MRIGSRFTSTQTGQVARKHVGEQVVAWCALAAGWSRAGPALKAPWHYDLVVERVAELALTRTQLLDLRQTDLCLRSSHHRYRQTLETKLH